MLTNVLEELLLVSFWENVKITLTHHFRQVLYIYHHYLKHGMNLLKTKLKHERIKFISNFYIFILQKLISFA